ncbi:hypothetical protein ACFL1Y_00475 [Patescibacteria group bacterium]
MTSSIITSLEKHGLITNVIGEISYPIHPALVVWARKEPKYQFRALIALAQTITPYPLSVYVDDVCTQVIVQRSYNEQEIFNKKYIEFFQEHGCVVKLSSVIYKNQFGVNKMPLIINIGQKTSITEFFRCLPKKKQIHFDQLHLDEIMHMLLELLFFEQVSDQSNLLIVGNFSQAIVLSHRNISNNPLAAIVTPKFNNQSDVNNYIMMLKNIKE